MKPPQCRLAQEKKESNLLHEQQVIMSYFQAAICSRRGGSCQKYAKKQSCQQ